MHETCETCSALVDITYAVPNYVTNCYPCWVLLISLRGQEVERGKKKLTKTHKTCETCSASTDVTYTIPNHVTTCYLCWCLVLALEVHRDNRNEKND